MSLFGWLTGGAESAKKVVDAAIATGDALFYTDEEKAQSYAEYRKWYLKYLEATQPQNVARRVIAIIITLLWSLVVFVALLSYFLHSPDFKIHVMSILNIVSQPFMVIVGFYFVSQVVSRFKDKKDGA